VIVGFHRYRTQAIARTHRGFWVIPSMEREQKMAEALPLDRLGISPRLRDELAPLGVRTLGDFLALPREGLRMHFGAEAEALHERASDDHWAPLQPRAFIEAIRESLEIDPPEVDHDRLLFRIKPILEALVSHLAKRSAAMSALLLDLHLERSGAPASAETAASSDAPGARTLRVSLTPAAPTLDALQILDLIRLRLGALKLEAPIEMLTLELSGVRAHPSQLALFEARRKRDLEAGSRALARLRASLGNDAVTRARLRDAHLPEASFLWEPIQTLSFPGPKISLEGPLPLVRCLFTKHLALPGPPRGYDGWPLGPRRSAMAELHGPIRISGGWWVKLVERDYYFARTRHDDLPWLYYDRPRRRWFQQGFLD
jgi:protein ImuB